MVASPLKEVDCRWNTLTGAIPAELGSLAQLEDLVLTQNTLRGAIPDELQNCKQLAPPPQPAATHRTSFEGCGQSV